MDLPNTNKRTRSPRKALAAAVRSIIRSPVKSRRRTQQQQHHSDSDSDLDDLAPEVERNVVTTIFHDEESSQDTDYEPQQDEIDWESDYDNTSIGDGSSQGSIDSIDFEYMNLVLEAGKEITDEEKAIVDTRIVIDSNEDSNEDDPYEQSSNYPGEKIQHKNSYK